MTTYYSQGVDYLGFLDGKLRDLQGYTTLAHELIQNADDAEAASMSFDLRDEALVVENTSKFSDCGYIEADECPWKTNPDIGHRCDFHRFRKVAGGDKREQEATTGAFGIGFISVYQITDAPRLLSGNHHWIIRPDNPEHQRIKEESLDGEPLEGTRFIFPWATDPTSPLRQRLRIQAVDTSKAVSALIEVLTRALPNAILFLKHVRRIELRRNGAIVTTIQRIDSGDQVVVQSGEARRSWHIFRGSFDTAAADLKQRYPGQIEQKRTAQVTVAIPEHAHDINGLFCVCLPTEQHTDVPFHINADFYPSTDRKRILFSDDHQGEWNRAAITAAANIVANALPALRDILGRVAFWELLNKIHKLYTAVEKQVDKVFAAFWDHTLPCLKTFPVVAIWPDGWKTPTDVLQLKQKEEEEALPLLSAMGFHIIHPDLRAYFSLLESIEVRQLTLRDLVLQLKAAGLDKAMPVDEAPEWMQPHNARVLLGQEIVTLSNQRLKREELALAKQEIRTCAIAFARDGYLRPPATLFSPSQGGVAILRVLGREDVLLADDNPLEIGNLVEDLTPEHMLTVLKAVPGDYFTDLWRERETIICAIIDWFVDQRQALLDNDKLKARLCALPIWPSGQELHPLNDLFIPGAFDDPLGLASLLDRKIYDSRRDFLREIGAKRLNLQRYAQELIPQALSGNSSIGVDERWQLVDMLAERRSELSDNPNVQRALAASPLVTCQDGKFRAATKVYFASDAVTDCLDAVPLAYVAGKRPEATRELYQWLGVLDQPRLQDVIQRIKVITTPPSPPSPEHRAIIARVFRHLSARDQELEKATIKRELGRYRWLPAREKNSRWYMPEELYAVYQDYLIESQADFLDIDRNTQNIARDLIALLQIQVNPPVSLVVAHILESANQGKPVNMAVYTFLDHNASTITVKELRQFREQPSFFLNNSRYIIPSHTFWNEHPYGRYRVRLTSDMRKYSRLLDRIGVQETPSATDSLNVLREIADAYHPGDTLDEETTQVIANCWQHIGATLEHDETIRKALASLSELPIISAPDGQLRAPDVMFLDDRPGIANQFHQFKDQHTVARVQGAWRAMEASGVRSLSNVVKATIVECDQRMVAADLVERLRTRWSLIVRVAESLSTTSGTPLQISFSEALTIDHVARLMITYEIRVDKQTWASAPEEVAAYFDAIHQVVYVQSHPSGLRWAALARELAFALAPQSDAVSFALGLKEVLSAETEQAAAEALDELGYPQLELREIDIIAQEAESLGIPDQPVDEMVSPDHVVGDDAVMGDDTSEEIAPAQDDEGPNTPSTTAPSANEGSTPSAPSGPAQHPAQQPYRAFPSQPPAPPTHSGNGTRPTNTPVPADGNGHSPMKSTVGQDVGATHQDRHGARTGDETPRGTNAREHSRDTAKTSPRQRGKLRTYVTPAREDAKHTIDGSAMDARISAIDQAGIACVLQYERAAGRYPQEMPHENKGYDIESCDIAGTVVRYIEVKSMAALWDSQGVGLSAAQFNTGHMYSEQYWLYIVEQAEHPDAQIYRIQNPAVLVDQFFYDDGWRSLAEDDYDGTHEQKTSVPVEEDN